METVTVKSEKLYVSYILYSQSVSRPSTESTHGIRTAYLCV